MIQSMTVSQLKAMMEEETSPLLIDCRERSEWEEGHIPGAVLFPLSTLEQDVQKLEDEKSRPIVLQCRSGKRSLRACQFLSERGFENLHNLEGGILAWMECGYDIDNRHDP